MDLMWRPLVTRETSGLAGMRERATLAGGQLRIESRVGEGTRMLAELEYLHTGNTKAKHRMTTIVLADDHHIVRQGLRACSKLRAT